MYAKPSSLLDSQATHGCVSGLLVILAGTKDLRKRIAAGACNRLPITVSNFQS